MSASGPYGYHPTSYAGLTDEAFYDNFRYEAWSKLDEAGRQELLQEAVNRSAAAHGELGSCKVIFDDLGPTTAGVQSGDTIRLNREMYVNERQQVQYKGNTYTHPVGGANMRALTTALHEDEHAYQNQVTAGLIPAKDAMAANEYASNDFTNVVVQDANGNPRVGNTYLRGETPGPTGYVLYYFQSSERDAHKFSEEKASAIMADLQARHGLEPSFMSFRSELESNGYAATLDYAQKLTGEANVEGEINKSLMNHYYGTNMPVEPRIEALVSNEMILSHDAMANGRPLEVGEGQKGAVGAAAGAAAGATAATGLDKVEEAEKTEEAEKEAAEAEKEAAEEEESLEDEDEVDIEDDDSLEDDEENDVEDEHDEDNDVEDEHDEDLENDEENDLENDEDNTPATEDENAPQHDEDNTLATEDENDLENSDESIGDNEDLEDESGATDSTTSSANADGEVTTTETVEGASAGADSAGTMDTGATASAGDVGVEDTGGESSGTDTGVEDTGGEDAGESSGGVDDGGGIDSDDDGGIE